MSQPVCHRCRGRGTVHCQHCFGRGLHRIGFRHELCLVCVKGDVECGSCEGYGYIRPKPPPKPKSVRKPVVLPRCQKCQITFFALNYIPPDRICQSCKLPRKCKHCWRMSTTGGDQCLECELRGPPLLPFDFVGHQQTVPWWKKGKQWFTNVGNACAGKY